MSFDRAFGSKAAGNISHRSVLLGPLSQNSTSLHVPLATFCVSGEGTSGNSRSIRRPSKYTPHFSQHVSAVAQDCRDGVFSGTNDLVEKLTGQMPLQMVDYIIKNKAAFSLAEKNQNKWHLIQR
jgi:hypothetical protein